MNKKVAIIIGTRPEAIKLLPVFIEMTKRNIAVEIVSTGQHASMLDQIYDFYGIQPSFRLEVMQADQTLAGLSARLTERLQNLFLRNKYDLVLVQGDTTTAFVSSLVAFYNHIPVGHIEAGLRTKKKYSPFPEEINRQLISKIADYHFAPTKLSLTNLIAEGVDNCYMVGNTVIDSLFYCLQRINHTLNFYESKYEDFKKYDKVVLITGHRRENFGNGFQGICSAIKRLSEIYPNVLFFYPVHLNPNVKNTVFMMLGNIKNIQLVTPLPYDELVYVMSKSYLILTDSGGIQEEGPSLNVPILVMRDTTERPEAIESGCSQLVGTLSNDIVSATLRLMTDSNHYMKMASAVNPFGDGRSAPRIVDILTNFN